ncbi:MAG TPA: site-specific integrase [Candidatus Izemoplasmatales bacterium]|nr:site-specific integrase [Candidatus Izemoplasmatales bacterium]
MANRIRSVISKIFEFGLKRVGLDIDRNPVDSTAPFDKGENVRERVYSVDEIRELWEYWETRPEPVQSVYKVLLLTGQRLSEVLHMKWKYIEVDRPCKRIRFDEEGRAVPEAFLANVWTIPDTKNNEIHELPLSNMAFGIIQDLKPATGDSDYVFESPRKKGAPLNSLNSTDKMIKKHTSVSDFRIHDLRRTFATRTEESGIDYSIIKKVLNHKDGDVTSRHYTWYDFMDRKLDAMNRWAWRLQSIVEGKEETKIFSIKHGL